jgi:hypothetical protein
MTERLGTPNEQNAESMPEGYEVERQVEDYVRQVMRAGSELYEQTFPTAEEAQAGAAKFLDVYTPQDEFLDDSTDIVLRATGAGTLFANLQYDKDDSGVVTVHTNPTQPLLITPLYESRTFKYGGIYVRIVNDEESSGIRACPYVYGKDMSEFRKVIGNNGGFPVVTVSIDTMLFVPCNQGAEIESVKLERRRRHDEAMIELMACAEHYPDIINDLDIINKEINKEYATQVKELQHIENLREIGKRGAEFSAISPKHADVLNTAIATTIHRGRSMKLKANVYFVDDEQQISLRQTKQFQARLIDVVSNIPNMDAPTGQVLAVTSLAMPPNKRTYYVPLSEIESLLYY